MEITLIEKALRIAVTAHAGQVRKEGNIPYIVHPVMVAHALAVRGFEDTVVAAALVHDVLEDTEFTEEALVQELGEAVHAIVRAVTNDDSLSWEEKKRAYIESVRLGPDGAKAVATADKIHNAESLIRAHEELGSALWEKFNASKEQKLWFEEAMLAMLEETWSDPLIEEYRVLVARMRALV
ncbi:MAG TPA: HD domain-containing protein [Candidatus Paceibacterota bacterium]|nr:HD domain-containing protein [Candidatus Paceibacterota bacterium]